MKRYLSPILLLLALAVPASASATTFGAEVGSVFINQTRGEPAAQAMTSLKALYKAGGRVGKADSDWAGAEPRRPVHGHHTYLWGNDDTIVTELAQARLRLEPSLELAPTWARAHRADVVKTPTGPFVVPLPPAKSADYTAYATAFMHRYGAHGSFWSTHKSLPYLPVTTVEVWNEPDNTHNWGPQVNLKDYSKLYEAARTAVHRVNRHAVVVTGGLAWTKTSLPRMLKAFRGKPIDAVAIHPYAATPNATIALTRDALSEMRRYGRGRVPVVANEYGWTSVRNTWGTTKASHVNTYVYDAMVGLAKLKLSQIIPFTWSSPAWGLSDGPFAQAIAKIHHR